MTATSSFVLPAMMVSHNFGTLYSMNCPMLATPLPLPDGAELPVIVLDSISVSPSKLNSPPPRAAAEFPESVELVIRVVWSIRIGIAEDPAAIGIATRCRVAADRAAGDRQIAIAAVDPAAIGIATRCRVAADRAAGDRQIAIAAGDPAAIGDSYPLSSCR